MSFTTGVLIKCLRMGSEERKNERKTGMCFEPSTCLCLPQPDRAKKQEEHFKVTIFKNEEDEEAEQSNRTVSCSRTHARAHTHRCLY